MILCNIILFCFFLDFKITSYIWYDLKCLSLHDCIKVICYLCFIREHVPHSSEIWVRPQIKVRIIDKNYKRGKYHKSKVKWIQFWLKKFICMMYEHIVHNATLTQSLTFNIYTKVQSELQCLQSSTCFTKVFTQSMNYWKWWTFEWQTLFVYLQSQAQLCL